MSPVDFHGRIERTFVIWGAWVAKRPVRVIFVSLSVMAVLATGLPRLRADFSNDSYLLAGDTTLAEYDAFRERYGRDDRIVLGVATSDVFDLAFLSRLRALHEEIEREAPSLHQALSLVNARSTRGVGDELVVDELGESWPTDAAELAAWRARVLANPLYLDFYVSRDATMAGLLVEADTYSSLGAQDDALAGFAETGTGEGPDYLTSPEIDALIRALLDIARRHDGPDFRISVVGDEVAGMRVQEVSSRDTARFMGLCVVLIGTFLFLLFRRLSAALLPLAVVMASVVSTFGVMGLLDLPFTTVTQILPSFLIAVGVCDSVHILSSFYRGLAEGKPRPRAVADAIAETGVAITLTSLTTAAGLASFTAAAIRPVLHLGILSPIGVLLALLFSITLLPALLALLPIRDGQGIRDSQGIRDGQEIRDGREIANAREAGPAGTAAWISTVLARLADFSTSRPRAILVTAALVFVAALPAVGSVRFSNDLMGWFWPTDPLRVSLLAVDEAFRGIATLEILVDSGRENGLYEPDTLRRIERAGEYAEALRVGPVETGKAMSLANVVHEIHQALHGGAPSERRIPETRALVAQELLLFENSGSDDLAEVTDPRFREARLSVRVRWTDGMHYVAFLKELERGLAEILGPDLPFIITGSVALTNRGFAVLLGSLARSYALALAVITPLMMLLLGSARRGLLAMIPNVMPVYLTLALMYLVDIPLNFSTLLMGSVVIGLAVDDTIHFVHEFDRASARGLDPRAAVHHTFASVGPALLVTTLVLSASFGVFVLGDFVGVVQFGVLASFAVLAAFLCDVLLAPALLVLYAGRRGPAA